MTKDKIIKCALCVLSAYALQGIAINTKMNLQNYISEFFLKYEAIPDSRNLGADSSAMVTSTRYFKYDLLYI